jgi:MFS transporter, MHS family, proline/betaine transporter
MPTHADRRRALISSCVANIIEWYDFAIFGAFASVLATVLLPPEATEAAFVSIFAVFATSFLARPVGALTAGVRADRRGRRRILVAMLLLMAGATGAIGLLPTWSAVGLVAPLSLVILRLLQASPQVDRSLRQSRFSPSLLPTSGVVGTAAGTPQRWQSAWH